MKTVRAWPSHPPPGRMCVPDQLLRVPVDRYDYRPLLDLDDHVISLDWDMAVSPDDLCTFYERCAREPEWPRVVPYKLWHMPDRYGEWAVYDPDWQPLRPGEPWCAFFGFGMVYLPRRLLVECVETRPETEVGGAPLTDCEFSSWYWRTYQRGAAVEWDLHPVHLHY